MSEAHFTQLVNNTQDIDATLGGIKTRILALREVLALKVVERNRDLGEMGLAIQILNFADHDWEVQDRATGLSEEVDIALGQFSKVVEAAMSLVSDANSDAGYRYGQQVEAQKQLQTLLDRRKEHALHNKAIRETVWNITDGKCFYCSVELVRCIGEEADRARCFHVDHLVPKACGGPDHFSNYVPACETCNISKGAKPFAEFMLAKREALASEVLGR